MHKVSGDAKSLWKRLYFKIFVLALDPKDLLGFRVQFNVKEAICYGKFYNVVIFTGCFSQFSNNRKFEFRRF